MALLGRLPRLRNQTADNEASYFLQRILHVFVRHPLVGFHLINALGFMILVLMAVTTTPASGPLVQLLAR
jgi:hypothetical protein